MVWEPVDLNSKDLEWFKAHIDFHIIRLIIKMNALPFLETTWSCGGHVGDTSLYHQRLSFLADKDSEEGESFIKELKELLGANFKFARLELPFPPKNSSEHPEYRLEVDRLLYPQEWVKDHSIKFEYYEEAERYFDETYGKLNKALEGLVDKWLQLTNRQATAEKWLKEIESIKI